MTETEKIIIYSEQLYTSKRQCEIVTILGSCVSICLYDSVNHIGGMNHYLLPLWNGDGLQSLRFGNISNERLLQDMLRKGADHRYLQAKIFGGAVINISNAVSVGDRNVLVAKDFLQKNGIPIVAEDVGGKRGRKIIFDTSNGDVYVKYSK